MILACGSIEEIDAIKNLLMKNLYRYSSQIKDSY